MVQVELEEAVLKRRQTMREQKRVLKNPIIVIGELSEFKTGSNTDNTLQKDSQTTLKKNDSIEFD